MCIVWETCMYLHVKTHSLSHGQTCTLGCKCNLVVRVLT